MASTSIDLYVNTASSYFVGYQVENQKNYELFKPITKIGTSTSNQIQKLPIQLIKFLDYPWVMEMFFDADKIVNVETLLPYYTHIHDILIMKKYKVCNDILIEIEVSNSSDVLLVGLLRLTFTWRHNLDAWKNFLDKVDNELISRKLDSKKILSGLF